MYSLWSRKRPRVCEHFCARCVPSRRELCRPRLREGRRRCHNPRRRGLPRSNWPHDLKSGLPLLAWTTSRRSEMIFMFFAAAIAAAFFVGALIALRLGLYLGLRHRKRNGADGNAGLATVEGAIFGLM